MTQTTSSDLTALLTEMHGFDYTTPHDPDDPDKRALDCDLVMKGGITSGVVYPLAVLEFAKRYRFYSIGGTSAGAIAASVTAAAEYGRGSQGFHRLIDLVNQLRVPGFLANLFQPAATLRPLMQILVIALKASRPRPRSGTSYTFRNRAFDLGLLLLAFIRTRWQTPSYLGSTIGAVLGVLLGGGWIAAALAASTTGAAWVPAVWGLLIIVLLWLLGGMLGVFIQIMRVEIVRNGFGICSGQPVPDHAAHRIIATGDQTSPALTGWLAAQIDTIAGVTSPLTFGDLALNHYTAVQPDCKITLNMVTTNLSQGRPYVLPFTEHVFLFSEEEWQWLFPRTVIEHLVNNTYSSPTFTTPSTIIDEFGQTHTLRFLPDAAQLPVIVATRLSLSFPLLLSAVPLWTISADTFASAEFEKRPHGTSFPITNTHVRRNWFSDGGICSNFPIHFYDKLFPRYPTFGINLSDLPEQRSNPSRSSVYAPDYQIHEDATTNQASAVNGEQGNGIVFPSSYPHDRPGPLWKPLGAGVPGFLSAILNTGLFYHDNLQSQLPSYYDRIVSILLSSTEGGLNLDMPPEAIDQIAFKGHLAGEIVNNQFNLPHHQWVRLSLLLSQLEQQMIALHDPILGQEELAPAQDLKALLDTIGEFLRKHQVDQNIVQRLIEAEIAANADKEQRFPYARDAAWRDAALPRLYLLLLLIEGWGAIARLVFSLVARVCRAARPMTITTFACG